MAKKETLASLRAERDAFKAAALQAAANYEKTISALRAELAATRTQLNKSTVATTAKVDFAAKVAARKAAIGRLAEKYPQRRSFSQDEVLAELAAA